MLCSRDQKRHQAHRSCSINSHTLNQDIPWAPTESQEGLCWGWETATPPGLMQRVPQTSGQGLCVCVCVWEVGATVKEGFPEWAALSGLLKEDEIGDVAESGRGGHSPSLCSFSLQKWLSSPFPSSSFSPSGPVPEISPLEVLDRDAKATQLLLLQQQDKGSSSSTETSGHSVTSCFTNQGYFFFHLPDALEIEACQVYFAYDPFTEEPDEGGPRVPEGALLPPLPPPPGEEDAYCTFPSGDDLLLFSPSLLGGPGPPNTALGGIGASEERLPPTPQEGVPGDWAPQPLAPPTQEAPDLVDLQSPPEHALGEAGEEVPVPSPREGAGFPWASSPGQGQVQAPTSCLTLNTDAYLSLQELQDQDPAHTV